MLLPTVASSAPCRRRAKAGASHKDRAVEYRVLTGCRRRHLAICIYSFTNSHKNSTKCVLFVVNPFSQMRKMRIRCQLNSADGVLSQLSEVEGLLRHLVLSPDLTDRETEAQRGRRTSPRWYAGGPTLARVPAARPMPGPRIYA